VEERSAKTEKGEKKTREKEKERRRRRRRAERTTQKEVEQDGWLLYLDV
jgi:hypothetical protein